MGFRDCLKNKWKCEDIYNDRYAKVLKTEADTKTIKSNIAKLQNQLTIHNKVLESKQSSLNRYNTYEDMWADIPPLEECGKKITREEIAEIAEKTWKVPFKYISGAKVYTFVNPRWVSPDDYYRVPMDIMKKIITRSQVDVWTYQTDRDFENGVFVCNDFAAALYSEFKSAPKGYSKAMIGILCVRGHRINSFIPAEEDIMYSVEPQNDKIWVANVDDENERKPHELMI